MAEIFNPQRQRIVLIKLPWFLLLVAVLLFSACGSSENTSSRPKMKTGSASLSLKWHRGRSQDFAAADPLWNKAISDCAAEGVEEVFCDVYAAPDKFMVQGGPWSCPERRGTIDGIPPGPDRTIICLGRNNNGELSHLGQISGVVITAGETTRVTTPIDFYPFMTLLTTPEDGAQVRLNGFSLNWDSVPNAARYQVQVSESPGFAAPIIDELVTETTYMPTVLLPEQTYYWRIRPVDPTGNQGRFSQVRTFDTLPGILCRAPVLAPIGNQVVGEGERLTLALAATDPDDGDELTFSSSPLPTGAAFDPVSGLFEWEPRFGDAGYYLMIFTVCDTCPQGALCDSEDITISVGDVCRPPVLERIGPRRGFENEYLIFTINGSDPDPESQLSFRADNLPPGAQFTPATRTFAWTPNFGDAGNYQVRFEVCDDCPQGPVCDAETVSITIGDVCRPPELGIIGNRQIDAGRPLTIRLTANDPDTESVLTYSMEADFTPAFDPQNGLFEWVPPESAAGRTYRVRFGVCDDCPGDPQCDFEEIDITVGYGCRPPVLDEIGPQHIYTEQQFLFTISATDPDADSVLTYSARDVAEGANIAQYFDPATRTFRWFSPPEGVYDVIFSACDDCPTGPLCDSERVTLTVESLCPAENSISVDELDTYQVSPGDLVVIPIRYDAPGYLGVPRYRVTLDGEIDLSADFDSQDRSLAWRPGENDIGDHRIRFDVCFSCPGGEQCGSTATTISVVAPPPERPILRSPAPEAQLDNGCNYYEDPIEWSFSWDAVSGAAFYEITISRLGRTIITQRAESTRFDYRCSGECPEFPSWNIYRTETEGWTWRVRAGRYMGDVILWGDWSDERNFSVTILDCLG